MALDHAASGQPVDVRPLGAGLRNAKTSALFKSEQLEVMRLVLPAGKAVPPHKVAGEITIQCLEGRMAVTADGAAHGLAAGQLLFLAGGVVHGVEAHEDATALVTIVLTK